MQSTHLVKPAPTAPKRREMSVEDLIAYLRGINEQRIIALSYYPNAVAQIKWDAVAIIRAELHNISSMLNPKQQVRAILRLENHFLMLQPVRTSKLKQTYLRKVAMAMDACREFLNWQQQRKQTG